MSPQRRIGRRAGGRGGRTRGTYGVTKSWTGWSKKRCNKKKKFFLLFFTKGHIQSSDALVALPDSIVNKLYCSVGKRRSHGKNKTLSTPSMQSTKHGTRHTHHACNPKKFGPMRESNPPKAPAWVSSFMSFRTGVEKHRL